MVFDVTDISFFLGIKNKEKKNLLTNFCISIKLMEHLQRITT
ncbi:hypothetical protein cce_2290 [Crocosphaera subtropica ATCC 51142]|uniref:Uncharacterized protein n=1 Tax=Crocosphaera subtropica (strain ATCC 51142 / BH68) TaxID=43989 RepID=B1WPS0_CROS5|nr:hypothetical protein cce_2290 [Crocosphaera subtropica ATCC 51142]